MIMTVCIILAASIVLLVALAALLDWGAMGSARRGALAIMAGGLTWGGAYRFQAPVTPGDALFLGGLLAFLVMVYRQPLAAQVDALDGKADGHLGPLPLISNVRQLRPPTGVIIALVALSALGAAVGRSTVHAEAYKPVVLRAALQGPGRLAIVELDHYQTRAVCIAARDAFLKESSGDDRAFTTPDGLKWTVLGARCSVPGTPA